MLGAAPASAWPRRRHRLNWASSFSYSAWTALSSPAASCLPPIIFWSSGVQPWAKIEPVALAMKSIAPLSLATPAPAASVSLVTEPAAAGGTARSVGPPGFEPPTATSIWRAFSFVATQLKKNAAQSAFFALSRDAVGQRRRHRGEPCPPASAGGKTKNPTLPGRSLS